MGLFVLVASLYCFWNALLSSVSLYMAYAWPGNRFNACIEVPMRGSVDAQHAPVSACTSRDACVGYLVRPWPKIAPSKGHLKKATCQLQWKWLTSL